MSSETDRVARAVNDQERLKALYDTGLLDSPREPLFDRLTRLGTMLTGAPIALVSLVSRERQFFKSAAGVPDAVAAARQTPLSHSFCKHVVASGEALIIDDARVHPLVCDNPAVKELPVVAYLGIPLRTSDGYVLGSFCLIDRVERTWSEAEIEAARELAGATMREIEYQATLRALMEMRDDAVVQARLDALRELALGLRHEINNALMSLMAESDYLAGELTGELEQSAKLVQEQTRRIRDVLKRLEQIDGVRTTEYRPGVKMVDFTEQGDAPPDR